MQFACKTSSCACGKCMVMLSAEEIRCFLHNENRSIWFTKQLHEASNNSQKLCKLRKSAASHAHGYIKNVEESFRRMITMGFLPNTKKSRQKLLRTCSFSFRFNFSSRLPVYASVIPLWRLIFDPVAISLSLRLNN